MNHFIFEGFIKWMWDSIFKPFDENIYEEFLKLGNDGIRRNFSLDRYFIVRLLLCTYPNKSVSLFDFKEEVILHSIIKNHCAIKAQWFFTKVIHKVIHRECV